jgi:hypothetical protein
MRTYTTTTTTKSDEQKGNRAYQGSASDVVSAIAESLRRLVRGRRFDPGLVRIDLNIKEDSQEPGVLECQVDIKGDTTADRDRILKKFPASEGWTCKNTGEKTATCTNP